MIVLGCIFVQLILFVKSVPPDACFANFRWDDCGRKPTPVVYYYKPASRCEVGLWRGCLPNMNMFADEYECVSTCIYASNRVGPEQYHNSLDEGPILEEEVTETTTANSTDATGTTGTDGTGGSDGTTGDGDTGSTGDGTGATGGNSDTTPAGGDATTTAPPVE